MALCFQNQHFHFILHTCPGYWEVSEFTQDVLYVPVQYSNKYVLWAMFLPIPMCFILCFILCFIFEFICSDKAVAFFEDKLINM